MKEIFRELSQSAQKDIHSYHNKYMNNINQLYKTTVNPHILKSHIKTKSISEAEQLLRFSLVFNDLSLFTYNGGNKLAFNILSDDWFKQNFPNSEASIILNKKKLQELGVNTNNLEISPAFVFPCDDQISLFIEELHPFIENGKLILQPDRTLLYVDNYNNESGGRTLKTLDVSQDLSLDRWETIDETSSRAITFESHNSINQKLLFEVTIPYLDGVNFTDLSKILEDEEDLLSGLRSSIKVATQEVSNTDDFLTIRKDIIDPKVDALNRKFNSIVNSHFFKVTGAAVGTVALAYTAVSTVGVAASIATICGSGGLTLLGKEYSDYRTKINELKDDPYYFLWRCKQLQKKY